MAAPYQTTRKSNTKNRQNDRSSAGYSDAYEEGEAYGYQSTNQDNEQHPPAAAAGYYAVANNEDPIYNGLYAIPEPTSSQDRITDLHQLNEKGELKMFPFQVVDNADYPWIKVYITIGNIKRFGYLHASIVTRMMEEVTVYPGSFRTVVKVESGATIYERPGGEKLLPEPLKQNEEVFVVDVDGYDWAHVKYKGQEGYINVTKLNTGMPMPGTGAKLYKIRKGDTLESIINKKYDLQDGDDRRFYANVLMHVNNPLNEDDKGIFINDEFDLFAGITPSYDRFHVKENFLIWIPQKAYADALKGSISSGSYKKEVKKAIGNFGRVVGDVVDEYWPVNWGAFYGAEVGATFAIPVGADAQVETYFFRKDKDTIALKKYDRLALGLDTGISAGFHIGGKNTKKGSAVLGAHAGANAEAKGAVYGLAEYEFPIKDDDAVLSALMAILKGDSLAVNLGTLFLDALGGMQLNPANYLTKGKLALGIEAQVNAGASIGVKKAATDNQRETYTHKGSNASEKQADNYGGTALDLVNPLDKQVKLKDYVLKYLNIGAEAFASLNPKIGVEYSRKLNHDGEKVTTGEQTMEIFIEMGAKAKIQADLSILGKLGPVLDRGMGLKMTFTAKAGEEEWSAPMITAYTMSGELDYYDGGSASQAELELGNDVESIGNTLKNITGADFISLMKAIKFTKRVAIANFMNRKAGIVTTKNKEQQHMQKADFNAMFLSAEGYLDVVVDFSKIEEKILDQLARFVETSFEGETPTDQFLNGLKAVLDWSKGVLKLVQDNGIINTTVQELSNLLSQAIQSDVFPSIVLHGRIGAGFAAGAKLSLGAKVRLSGSVAGGFVYEADVKEVVSGYLAQDKVEVTGFMEKLNQKTPTVSDDLAEKLEAHTTALLDSGKADGKQ